MKVIVTGAHAFLGITKKQELADCLDARLRNNFARRAMRVGSLVLALLIPVVALALTRADKDKSYTKLDLLDQAAVQTFFEQAKPDGAPSS